MAVLLPPAIHCFVSLAVDQSLAVAHIHLLLSPIPKSYSDVKAAIKYGRDTVNIETVVNGLRSKEMDLRANKPSQNQHEVNSVRGRSKFRNSRYNNRSKSRSKSRNGNRNKSRPRENTYNDNRDRYEKKEKANNVSDDNNGEVYEPAGFVSMANEKKCEIEGLGDISLCFKEGYRLTLKNVRYVPDLSHNLISCAALEEDGLEGRWGKDLMKIIKGSLIVFKAERKCNLYICTVSYDNLAASVSECDLTALWHKRLGHISQKGLDFLRKAGILNEKIEKLDSCDDCVLCKHHKVHFPASPSPNPSMSTCILDYVHADIWGPSNVPNHGGNRYFLSIIDNFSRKVFIFLMKHKSEVFEKFEKWRVLVENQTGQKLKSLRIDNSSDLSKSFWGEVILTAAHLNNKSPSVPLLGKTPEHVWTGKIPDLFALRVFGCSAFVHQSVDKLELRAIKCVFIGYPVGVKGYRLWVRSQPSFKVLISRDVTFNENEIPCLEKTQSLEKVKTFNKVENNLGDNQHEGELENTLEPENETENAENLENPEPNPLENYQLARDRNRRQIRTSVTLKDFETALHTEMTEPTSIDEAMKSKQWLNAMNEEMKSLKENKTWVLVPKSKNASIVDCKWIYKIKQENPIKYKARLVAKGFTQEEGIDYNEIFSPVVKYTTISIILALTAHYNWELKQMDVKTAFLHGDLDENIYMCQPTGFVDDSKPDYVCLLKINVNDSPIFLVLYVDDMLIASSKSLLICDLQKQLCNVFEMKDLGNAKQILGMNISRNREKSSILLNQKSYIMSILRKFSMENSKPASVPLAAHFQLSKDQSPKTEFEKAKMEKVPYSNVIGSIMYLMVCTRPDIAYAISCLSRYMSNPAKYIATTEAFKEAIWLDSLIKEIGFSKEKVIVFSDSQSSIQLCKNPVFHDRTKHIDVRFHFTRDIVGKEVIKLEKIKTEENPADMGTKSLPVQAWRVRVFGCDETAISKRTPDPIFFLRIIGPSVGLCDRFLILDLCDPWVRVFCGVTVGLGD
ncbi:UNVERIFIED_CONTAM: Retrovirus-related Pol polyprotein from transposon TNT 1-94 [Sesamum indicum]